MDRNTQARIIIACAVLGMQLKRLSDLKKRTAQVEHRTDLLVQMEVDRRFEDIVKNFGRY